MINREMQENFQVALLRVLEANTSRFGLGVPALSLLVNQYGFTPKAEEVVSAMDYLEDAENGLVRSVEKGQMHPANRAWKVTAKGTNWLRERGY